MEKYPCRAKRPNGNRELSRGKENQFNSNLVSKIFQNPYTSSKTFQCLGKHAKYLHFSFLALNTCMLKCFGSHLQMRAGVGQGRIRSYLGRVHQSSHSFKSGKINLVKRSKFDRQRWQIEFVGQQLKPRLKF